MAMTIEKILKSAKVLEKVKPSKKARKMKAFAGLFPDIGRKLKKEGKTSVDLVREVRKTQ